MSLGEYLCGVIFFWREIIIEHCKMIFILREVVILIIRMSFCLERKVEENLASLQLL